MIDFRYHLVSTIAIFIALAVGIVLGSGPLKGPIDETLSQQAEQLRQDKEDLREDISALEREGQYSAEVIETLGPGLVGGRLSGRTAVIVTAPGADGGLVDALAASLTDAGAQVSGTVGVTEAWADPDREAELADATGPFVPAGARLPEDAGPRGRADVALAASLATADAAVAGQRDEEAAALLTALEDLEFVSLDGQPAEQADLALLVASRPPADAAEDAQRENSALVELAAALDRVDAGTLVAGPLESAGERGLLAALRGARAVRSAVSTVDSPVTAAGRVAVVLGLAAQLRGEAGAYGYGPGADDVLPEPAPVGAS